MATEVERLAVLLEAQTKQFENAMKRVDKLTRDTSARTERSLSRIEGAARKADKAFATFAKGFGAGLIGGFGIEAVSRAIVGVVKDVADLADEAERAAIGFEDLQLIADVAADAGIETETVVDLFQKLNKAIGEAVTKGNDLSKILALNNVPLRDQNGQVRDTLSLFYDVVDLVSRTKSQGEASAISMAAFSRSAEDALPFLKQGSASIKEGAQAARDAGRYMTDELGKSADETDKKWGRMWRSFETAGKTAALNVVRFIQDTDPYFLGQKLRAKIIESYSAGAADTNAVAARQQELTQRIAMATQDAFGFGAGAPDALLQAWKDELAGINAQLEISVAFLDAIKRKELPSLSRNPYETQLGVRLPEPDKTKTKKTKTKPDSIENRSLDEFQQQVAAVTAQTRAYELATKTMGLTTAQAERMRTEFELLNAAEQAGIVLTPQLSQLIGQLAQENGAAAEMSEKQRAAVEAVTQAQDAYNDSIMALGEMGVSAFESWALSGEKLEDVLENVAKALASAALQASLLGQGPLAGMFGTSQGGGLLGGLFKQAGGGNLHTGQPTLVGERGPELIVPKGAGYVVPNSRLKGMGGGGGMQVNVYNSGGGQVRTQEKIGPNGMKQLDVYIDGRIGAYMGGDKGSTLMNAKYGMSPSVKRR